MEGRLPPEPVRTRPEGILQRLEFAGLHLGHAAEEFETAQQAARYHSAAAETQIRGARVHVRHALAALAEAKRSLKRGTEPIAAGLGR